MLEFAKAESQWDLDRLYRDLAAVKGKHLSPMEKLHLRGLLSGYSPTEIANQLSKKPRGLEVDLSNTLYHYIKIAVHRSEEKIDDWREIRDWLEEAGYRKPYSQLDSLSILGTTITGLSHLEIDKVQIEKIQIEKIQIEKIKTNQKVIDIAISIHLITPLTSESQKKT